MKDTVVIQDRLSRGRVQNFGNLPFMIIDQVTEDIWSFIRQKSNTIKNKKERQRKKTTYGYVSAEQNLAGLISPKNIRFSKIHVRILRIFTLTAHLCLSIFNGIFFIPRDIIYWQEMHYGCLQLIVPLILFCFWAKCL